MTLTEWEQRLVDEARAKVKSGTLTELERIALVKKVESIEDYGGIRPDDIPDRDVENLFDAFRQRPVEKSSTLHT